MHQPLRIGLIGAGVVSRHHLIAWASIPDQARVVAVAAERTYDLAAAYQGSCNRTIAHFVNSIDNKPFETVRQDNLETLRLGEDCYRLSGWEALR